jgi:hypothetical protein
MSRPDLSKTEQPSEPIAVLLDTIWRAYKRQSCDKATAIDHLRYVADLTDVDASELLDCDVAPSARYEVAR